MSSSITVGTNSWISVTDATTYYATRLNADKYWPASLTDAQKDAALITAFRMLMDCGLFSLSASDTSDAVKRAQMEMALFLLQHGEDIDARKGLQAQGVTQAGIVSETYDLDKAGVFPIPPIVRQLLKDSVIEGAGFGACDVTRDDTEDV